MNIYDLYPDRITICLSSGCWVWNAGVSSEGYGRARYNGSVWYIHRLSFVLAYGAIDNGMLIRHTCHNTRCCNPGHLLMGTDLDNWHDSKDLHIHNAGLRANNWGIGGVVYRSLEQAVAATGISMMSIMKYTSNEVFDINAYRAGCLKANKIPKI